MQHGGAALAPATFCKGVRPRQVTDGSEWQFPQLQDEGPQQLHRVTRPGAWQTVAKVTLTGSLWSSDPDLVPLCNLLSLCLGPPSCTASHPGPGLLLHSVLGAAWAEMGVLL